MTTAETTLTKRTMTRNMPDGSRVVAHLEVRRALSGERFSPNGLSPAFSLTGEVFELHGTQSGATRERRYRRLLETVTYYGPASEPDTSGACHGAILRAFPELAQFAAMHLSDPETGEPMHGSANGWYWYQGSRDDITHDRYHGGNSGIYAHSLKARGLPDTDAGRSEYCYRVACELLRVDDISLDVERVRKDPVPAWGGEYAESIADYTTRVREAFSAFVDAQRERWTREAADARAFVESLPETER